MSLHLKKQVWGAEPSFSSSLLSSGLRCDMMVGVDRLPPHIPPGVSSGLPAPSPLPVASPADTRLRLLSTWPSCCAPARRSPPTCCVADVPPVPGVQGPDPGAGLRGVPEAELGQPAPGQPHAGPKEKPGLALRANVLPAVPELLQVSTAQEPWVWPGEGQGPCQMLSLCGCTVHTSGVLC